MKKIFTFLCAALMSVGMWAEPIEVVWNSYDIPTDGSGKLFTKDGVTVTCGGIDWDYPDFYNGGTFTTDLGNFTHIYVYASDIDMSGDGWSGTTHQQTWTGNAASVSFEGGMHSISDIWFYIEPASSAVPAWVKSGDAWDDATKTLTVNSNPVALAYMERIDIQHVIISDAVTSVERSAFELCINMATLKMGKNVTSIGDFGFYGCSSLADMTCEAVNPPTLGTNALKNCSALAHIYVPAESVEAYKAADGWSAYASLVEAIVEGEQPAGNTITWDNDFCSNVKACFDSWEWQHVEENNTKDGITVTYTYSSSDAHGMKGGLIDLYYQENILTFTSTVGDISKIEVYYSANYGSTPNGWTLDDTNKKFVWEGTAAAAVDMVGGYVYFNVDYIVFTVESQGGTTAVDNVQASKAQVAKTKKIFRDNKIFIMKDGEIFNLTGSKVK